jgi:membrane protein DedA with SNARE-associated domain
MARAAEARIAIDRGNLIRLNINHAFPLSCADIEGLRRVREAKHGGWMRRFLSGALPFYALAGLAMCMYLVLYKTDLFDLNAIVHDATASSWFPVFVCVLLESVFPYFGYFPGTALILMSVALNPKPADVSVFIVAWLAIIVGAVLSYGQARFFRPLLQRVASKAALSRCESLLDAYGSYARVALFVHPNACAMYFTALGLLGRDLTRELAYLGVGAAASVGVLFVVVTRLVSSVGTTDDGELQLLLAAGLVAIGTLVGLYAAWRPARAA